MGVIGGQIKPNDEERSEYEGLASTDGCHAFILPFNIYTHKLFLVESVFEDVREVFQVEKRLAFC